MRLGKKTIERLLKIHAFAWKRKKSRRDTTEEEKVSTLEIIFKKVYIEKHTLLINLPLRL